MRSIITKYDQYCLICSKPIVERHHFLGGTAKRKLADEDGLFAGLCPEHHNSSKMSVHQNKEMKVLSQALAQACWQRQYLANKLSENGGNADDYISESAEAFKARYGEYFL